MKRTRFDMYRSKHILKTGQTKCYDEKGALLPCVGTGQDGEFQVGMEVPASRFEVSKGVVRDLLTGLVWTKNANINGFPMSWEEGFSFVEQMNENFHEGCNDWRMPNRRELRSLLHMETMNPVLPPGHPFENVFHGWYWTSSTAAINKRYAWYIHLGGARMFYGRKDQECLLWPVRGISPLIPRTGQYACYDAEGREISCLKTGQDGMFRAGVAWPEPRFKTHGPVVEDKLTGLMWTRSADLANGLTTWLEAFEVIRQVNAARLGGFSDWRLPNINELESLVDCSQHSPALAPEHPFEKVREFYWSSTTSIYDPPWSWALYMLKGAVGVGLKNGRHFYVWAVRSDLEQ